MVRRFFSKFFSTAGLFLTVGLFIQSSLVYSVDFEQPEEPSDVGESLRQRRPKGSFYGEYRKALAEKKAKEAAKLQQPEMRKKGLKYGFEYEKFKGMETGEAGKQAAISIARDMGVENEILLALQQMEPKQAVDLVLEMKAKQAKMSPIQKKKIQPEPVQPSSPILTPKKAILLGSGINFKRDILGNIEKDKQGTPIRVKVHRYQDEEGKISEMFYDINGNERRIGSPQIRRKDQKGNIISIATVLPHEENQVGQREVDMLSLLQ